MSRVRPPSYSHNNPRGWCDDPRRGAALGRRERHEKTYTVREYAVLRPAYVSSDGYDFLGTYWGLGTQLWWCATSSYSIDFCFRAPTRKEAEEHVQRMYPHIKFYKERKTAT